MIRQLHQIGKPVMLVEEALREQNDLTAVERFSQLHESQALPRQQQYYRDLIPLNEPTPGQQYAFAVDLDKCTGCKACVTACHNLNGLDETEAWRDVGLLLGGTAASPYQQTVTTACHHCVEPGCMLGCPVKAYEKDDLTGIVRHLDDQCFGCQYCTLMCPYDVPKYNSRLGIVRKCDMCSQRLQDGEAPACVQACPNQAIRIEIVEQEQMARCKGAASFLTGTPDPAHTQPTTQYTTKKTDIHSARPADFAREMPKHAHFPLVGMLVLTQASVGMFAWALPGIFEAAVTRILATAALGTALAALGVCLLHLGRPQYAFRAVLGFRTSWLSREIIAFGGYAKIAALYVLTLWLAPHWSWLHRIIAPLWLITVLSGIAGIYCSLMVYHVTAKPSWQLLFSAPRFTGTTLLLGSAAALSIAILAGSAAAATTGLAIICLLATVGKLLMESSLLNAWYRRPLGSPLQQTAALIQGPLLPITLTRVTLGLVGASSILLAGLIQGQAVVALCTAGTAMILAAELSERTLFFKAVCADKMPGNLAE